MITVKSTVAINKIIINGITKLVDNGFHGMDKLMDIESMIQIAPYGTGYKVSYPLMEVEILVVGETLTVSGNKSMAKLIAKELRMGIHSHKTNPSACELDAWFSMS